MNYIIDDTLQNIIFNGNEVQRIVYNSIEIWRKVQPFENQYLTIECVEGGDFSFDGTWIAGSATYDITLYYSKNGGAWTEIHSTSPTTFSCLSGDKFRFKGINDAISPMVGTNQSTNSLRFTSGDFKVYGNVMSVLFGDNFKNATLTTGTNDYAFKDLFNEMNITNNSLTDVENLILPDILTPHCFRAMFQYSRISSAPVLRATTLVDSCYRFMFNVCNRLNYIKCYATSGININNSTYNWVQNVSNSGTFLKYSSSTWPNGNSGIPTTWTVKDIATTIPDIPTITCDGNLVTITSNGAYNIYYRIYGTSEWSEYTSPFTISATTTYEAYASNEIGDSNICNPVECVYQSFDNQYLTIELIDSGSILWKMLGSGASYTIEYSKNEGSWTSVTSDTAGVSITGVSGDKFRFRGNNLYYNNGVTTSSSYKDNYSFFDIPPTVRCNIYGNIMSLINGDNFVGTGLSAANIGAFVEIFKPSNLTNGNGIIDAENLILPVGNVIGCFRAMFAGSRQMTKAPKVVNITNVSGATYKCYYMFQYCSSLETAPFLPATSANNYDYQYMFSDCTSLISCTSLLTSPTFTSSGICFRMFRNITSSGTLYKNSSASWTKGANAVPNNWTITNYQ